MNSGEFMSQVKKNHLELRRQFTQLLFTRISEAKLEPREGFFPLAKKKKKLSKTETNRKIQLLLLFYGQKENKMKIR